jgi:ubiquinone/menaquinone biosynthesis C-methylase UbiE
MSKRATDVTQFHSVDTAAESQFLIGALERLRSIEGGRAARAALIDRLSLRQGDSAIDVGCGFGDDAREMAGRVGASGRVVGVDVSASMINEARRRHPASVTQLSWRVADALDLPFPDGSFDAAGAATVLQHVPDPAGIVREMTRLLRPGGRLAVLEFDHATTFLDSPDRETTRVICDTATEAFVQGWMGRQLPRLFHQAGLQDVNVEPRTVTGTFDDARLILGRHVDWLQDTGVLSPDAVERWWSELADAERAGQFTMGTTTFLVTGRRGSEPHLPHPPGCQNAQDGNGRSGVASGPTNLPR